MKYDNINIEYDNKNKKIKIGYDIDGDNIDDITMTIKIKAFLKKYIKHEIAIGAILALFAILHKYGMI